MAGNSVGNKITNEITYMANLLGKGQMPYAGALSSIGLGLPGGAQAAGPFGPRGIFGQRPTAASQSRPPMPNLPKDYKRTELAAGAAAEAFRPGAGFPGQQAAGDRAYQQEFSRVAQLTAQDPELQRYEAARKLAVAPGATPEQVQSAEDIGMQIWAQKYGKTLAPKVKPGQSGYDAIQGVLNAGAMGTPMDLPFDTKNVLGGKPMPEGLSYGTTAPTAIPGGTPIKGGGFPEGQAAMFQRFMQGSATTAPTFQGSPLGTTPQLNALNYGGAVQPLGAAVSDDFYKTEKAKELAAMFANYRLGQ
jgi:hypothetical protein